MKLDTNHVCSGFRDERVTGKAPLTQEDLVGGGGLGALFETLMSSLVGIIGGQQKTIVA